MNLEEMTQTRQSLYLEGNKVMDAAAAEKRSMTSEEREKCDRLDAEVQTLTDQIEDYNRRSKFEKHAAEMNKVSPRVSAPATGKEYNRKGDPHLEFRNATKNWLLCGSEFGDRSEAAVQRGQSWAIDPTQRSMSFHVGPELEKRGLTVGGSTAGAELAPKLFPGTFAQYLAYLCPILDYVSIYSTGEATNVVPYPIVDDTGSSATIVAEEGTIPDQSAATANVDLKAFKYASGLQKVSIEFLRAAVGAPETKIFGMLTNRIARTFAAHAVSTNAGSSQPQGLAHAAGTAAAVLGTRGTLETDKILDAMYAVSLPYSNNNTIVCHRDTVAALRKLKDSQGRYLWEPNVQVGQPSTFNNVPILISNDMPTLATSGAQKVLLVGDLRQYVTRVAGPAVVQRSDDRFMEVGLIAFSALQFLDARWTGPSGAIKAVGNPAS